MAEGDGEASTSAPGEASRKKAKVSIDDAKDTEDTEKVKEKLDAPTTRPHQVRTKTRPRVAPSSSNQSQTLESPLKPQAEGQIGMPKPGKRRKPKDGSVRTN